MKLPKRQKETELHRNTVGVVSVRQRKGQFLLRSDYLRKPLKITQEGSTQAEKTEAGCGEQSTGLPQS